MKKHIESIINGNIHIFRKCHAYYFMIKQFGTDIADIRMKYNVTEEHVKFQCRNRGINYHEDKLSSFKAYLVRIHDPDPCTTYEAKFFLSRPLEEWWYGWQHILHIFPPFRPRDLSMAEKMEEIRAAQKLNRLNERDRKNKLLKKSSYDGSRQNDS